MRTFNWSAIKWRTKDRMSERQVDVNVSETVCATFLPPSGSSCFRTQTTTSTLDGSRARERECAAKPKMVSSQAHERFDKTNQQRIYSRCPGDTTSASVGWHFWSVDKTTKREVSQFIGKK